MEKRSSGLLAVVIITFVLIGLTSFLFFFLSSPDIRGVNFYVAYIYMIFLELVLGTYLSFAYIPSSGTRTQGKWDFFFTLGVLILAFFVVGISTVILFFILNMIVSTNKVLLTVVIIEVALFALIILLSYFFKASSTSTD